MSTTSSASRRSESGTPAALPGRGVRLTLCAQEIEEGGQRLDHVHRLGVEQELQLEPVHHRGQERGEVDRVDRGVELAGLLGLVDAVRERGADAAVTLLEAVVTGMLRR